MIIHQNVWVSRIVIAELVYANTSISLATDSLGNVTEGKERTMKCHLSPITSS